MVKNAIIRIRIEQQEAQEEQKRLAKEAKAQNKGGEYAVIIDRISQDVPFYRAFLKNAALTGTNVINNPFWWSADDKFFNNCLADTLGVPLPNTVILPSAEHPTDTTSKSINQSRAVEMLVFSSVYVA